MPSEKTLPQESEAVPCLKLTAKDGQAFALTVGLTADQARSLVEQAQDVLSGRQGDVEDVGKDYHEACELIVGNYRTIVDDALVGGSDAHDQVAVDTLAELRGLRAELMALREELARSRKVAE